MPEILPDKVSVLTNYGKITARDGNDYRVARGGFRGKGARLKLIEDLVREAPTPEEIDSLICEAFHLAMEPFYNSERIDLLLSESIIGNEQAWELWTIVGSDDLRELKKNSVDMNSTPSAGA
jgi:hypothetical protein